MAPADLAARVFALVLMAWSWFRDKIWHSGSTIPEPGLILHLCLASLFGTDDLKKLDFLSEYFFSYGLFRFRNHVYILDSKYCQTVITKLDKGAAEYLSNSPLSNSFLGSSQRSPEVRRSIAAIFRKSNMDQKGLLMIGDIHKMVKIISREPVINVSKMSLKLALDIVGHVLLDLDLQALEGRQDRLLECMMTILHKAYALQEITADSKEFSDASEQFDKLTANILEDALNSEAVCANTNLPGLLQEACGFDEAKDNLKLFLMAGSETAAATIPIVLHVLAIHPHIQGDLQKEADEFADVLGQSPGVELPLMEKCLKEVLRLYPIAPYISRQTHSNLLLGRVQVPQQTDLRIFMWGIHRSPFLWEDSKKFKPDRFSKSDSSTRSQSNLWIPFGAGSRVCIGQHMAWVELKLVLTFLLRHFTFCLLPETSNLQFCVDWEHAVVHPRTDVILGVKHRGQ